MFLTEGSTGHTKDSLSVSQQALPIDQAVSRVLGFYRWQKLRRLLREVTLLLWRWHFLVPPDD